MLNKKISHNITVFHGLTAPEQGTLVGYGAIIEAYKLPVPLPDVLSLISSKKRQYKKEQWQVFTPRHLPEDNLYKNLVFALKYEGVNLLVLKQLFTKLSTANAKMLFQIEPLGQYSRKLWFLYEWLLNKKLSIPDLLTGNYVQLLDDKLQFAVSNGIKSSRHRIVNNLPGTREFCPLIRRTEKLDKLIASDLSEQKNLYLKSIHKDIMQRASAFLLLKDSKASFSIEGEIPKAKRAARWANAIGQAGVNDLTIEELLRLQQVVIENNRFIEMGLRKQGGFVGQHDRISSEPLPEHVSARWQDLDRLLNGLIVSNNLLLKSDFEAVLSATIIAFGFVFIHPFQDGNGRIHRYLIHHMLAKKGFSHQGIIFPISASILDSIHDYRKVLEHYSKPLLNFIEWKEAIDHNIEVLNETVDYYRFFDATIQAEFLYNCVNDTLNNIIPNEVNYLKNYDEFKWFLDNEFEMPDKMVAMLVGFLDQNNGNISKRGRNKEFASLTNDEVLTIENKYIEIFSE